MLNPSYLLDAPMTTPIETSTEVRAPVQPQPVQEVASFGKKDPHFTRIDLTLVQVY